MIKRENVITFGGSPLTLLGSEIKAGEAAPDFTVLNKDLHPVSLADYKGKNILISVAPSIDTPVCSAQTRRFNEEIANLKDVEIFAISVDLPFALGRYCAAEGIDKIQTLSDHKDLSFGNGYGFVIEELRLLARGIVIIDKDGMVRYVEYVGETTEHPDYEAAIKAVKEL